MYDKFQNKYRITSHRKPGWNYSSSGNYFITLVTQHRICSLGKIVIDKNTQPCISLSKIGEIVNAEWLKSFEIRDELFLDTYIIMPNHLHAIVVLEKNDENNAMDGLNGSPVETHGRASLQPTAPSTSSINPPLIRLPKSISSFLAGFKSAVNSKIDDFIDANNLKMAKYNRNNHFFQANYYDHIIRNEDSYQRIKNYIIQNPANWSGDKFYQ